MGVLVLIGICVLVVRGIDALFSKVKPALQNSAADCQPRTSDLLPYTKQKFFFSAAERSFYEVVRRLAPDHTLFAKVRLVDLVQVRKDAGEWQSHFNRINRKHLDFVLCDSTLAPILAIELDDVSHEHGDRAERDDFVNRVLAAAAVPLLRVRAKRGYVLSELQQLLHPYIAVKAPLEVAAGAKSYMPPAGWRRAV